MARLLGNPIFCCPCSLFCKNIFFYLVLHESALYDENSKSFFNSYKSNNHFSLGYAIPMEIPTIHTVNYYLRFFQTHALDLKHVCTCLKEFFFLREIAYPE